MKFNSLNPAGSSLLFGKLLKRTVNKSNAQITFELCDDFYGALSLINMRSPETPEKLLSPLISTNDRLWQ